MKFIIGKKVNMGQIFSETGEVSPVTFVKAEPVVVTQIKTLEKDGYDAVQVAFNQTKDNRISKPQKGHLKENGAYANFREFRVSDPLFSAQGESASGWQVGDKIDVSQFAIGDKVIVSGVSKGKGFQGVVKRHGFKGGRRSHGQKHSEREAGSIGGGPGRAGGRVVKGMRMAGRMGNDRVSIKGIEIKGIIPEENLLMIGGALPGRSGTVLEIKVD